MPKIKDSLSRAKISRQRRYQKRRIRDGLCPGCGNPSFRDKSFCQTHYVSRRLAQLGLFTGGKSSVWVFRREAVTAFAIGAFSGAILKTSTPFRDWQHVREIVLRAFFADTKRNVSLVKVQQFSRWLYRWDQRLRAGDTKRKEEQ